VAKRGGAPTLAADAYATIRRDILSARRAPGSPVPPAKTAVELGVGVGVVREALTRLAEHGLIEAQPSRGYYVTSVAADGLRQICDARDLNETRALELSLAKADIEWESQIVAAHHRLRAAAASRHKVSKRPEYEELEAHRAFHLALLAGCDNAYIYKVCDQLLDVTALYCAWSDIGEDAAAVVQREHDLLMESAIGRDRETSLKRLRRHLTRTSRLALTTAPEPVGP
jgi:DNA-binding GntR family transcriptional regulator